MAATSRTSPAAGSVTSAESVDPVDSVAESLQPQLSLRERKKIKTRTAIRRATYRLIAEQGYEATTVEQIAEAAEVSPSTVFRYFPTKEDIVLTDEFDPIMLRELRSRPAGEPRWNRCAPSSPRRSGSPCCTTARRPCSAPA